MAHLLTPSTIARLKPFAKHRRTLCERANRINRRLRGTPDSIAAQIRKAKPMTAAPTKTTMTPRPRPGRTPEQIKAEQHQQAESDHQRQLAARPALAQPNAAKLPATTNTGTAVAAADQRTPVQKFQDDDAPAGIVGRPIKFDGKVGEFSTPDDQEPVPEDVDFVALCDQTAIGYVRFNGEGNPPDRILVLPYDGQLRPPRDTLGDMDPTTWPIGLSGRPEDPWQLFSYLVLQRADTAEYFTFNTTSITGRAAVATLCRHYDRLQKTHPDMYPIVRCKPGGYQSQKFGWVHKPIFAVVGRHPKDAAAMPVDSSLAADLNDEIPFN
jgi:hypothetical protein